MAQSVTVKRVLQYWYQFVFIAVVLTILVKFLQEMFKVSQGRGNLQLKIYYYLIFYLHVSTVIGA